MITIHDIVLGPVIAARASGDCVTCRQMLNRDPARDVVARLADGSVRQAAQ